jgi:hypothetical protein
MAIADPMDQELKKAIRIVETRDDSTALGRAYLCLYDKTVASEPLEPADMDITDPEQVAIYKTAQVLLNKVIYTDSYLRL